MKAPVCLWSILCDHFLLDVSGKYSLIGVLDRIGAASFPAVHKVLYAVVALEGEPHTTLTALLDVWAPDGALVVSTAETTLQFGPVGRTLFVNLFYDLQLPAAGQYHMTLEAGGKPLATFSFEVYALPPGPSAR